MRALGHYGSSTSDSAIIRPYLVQKPINTQDEPVFTLAIVDVGHTHNWVVCRALEKRKIKVDHRVAEVNVLKKVGVIRIDSCGELLVGGENGASLLQQMDCLFV